MSIELPRLSQDFYNAIYSRDCAMMFDYCVIEKTEIFPADAILALGYRDLREDAQVLPRVGLHAAELFHAGLAPRVIVSGGVAAPFFQDKTEANVLKDILVAKGVPRSAIIVENNATNTQENVLFARDLNKGRDIKSLISVGHAIYGRRILMTVAQNWPEIDRSMLSNVWYPGFHAQNWYKSPEYFSLAIAQFDRIAPYVAQRFIKEVEMIRPQNEPN